MDFSYPASFIRDRPGFFYGSGTHRMDGILIGAGDGIVPQVRSTPASLLDLAPTILEGMGLAPPADLSGRSLLPEMGLST